ncbi:uncharacterized protein LOC133873506 isoform X1 [Alnus glutinosa]|uniref:uncharacterized protein LOC133873506 isoform X1 n=1 Tax=Alnus glutinosa TaxID=3517 RepID=UPI002D76B55D|nr:uncharacterized protein LOC133873506 isoform X1 [Alnus glutinosa]
MAETSSLRFSPFPWVPSISRSREPSSSLPAFTPSPKSSASRPRPSRLLRFAAKASDSGNSFAEESFGFFPWNEGDSEIQWVPEERVTLFTADGLIQIGGSMVPRRVSSSERKQGGSKAAQRFQRFQESDYMDPKQGLCLGALFDIAATNVSRVPFAVLLPASVYLLLMLKLFIQGLDMGRRLCIFGFCRSIEMLSDVVEDTVLEHGGEVVAAQKASKGGLHEKLTMTVAVPLLWGVPPVSETLHLAVQSGGGIVEKVYWQWDFL